MATETPKLTPKELEDILTPLAPRWQQICKQLQLNEEEVRKLQEGNADPAKADDTVLMKRLITQQYPILKDKNTLGKILVRLGILPLPISYDFDQLIRVSSDDSGIGGTER